MCSKRNEGRPDATTRSIRTGSAVLLGAGLLLGLTVAEGAPHGAMDMDAQERALDPLLAGRDVVTQPPAGVDPVVWQATIPKGNELTAERVALGRKLYFDVRLSADGTVSCATCHDVSRSFTDLDKTSRGIGDKRGKRNAPTTLNASLLQTQFWDGRAATVDDQAKLPIINPIEMGQPNGEAAAAAIAKDPDYQRMFQAAYGRAVNYDDIGRAIGAFERTLVFLDAPLDAYLAGDAGAISDDARKGWELFNGRGRCVSCHPLSQSNPLGTDNRFHNIGVSARAVDFEALAKKALAAMDKDSSEQALERIALEQDTSELGRFNVTRRRADIGGFRTPQLRNIGITPPYMHDGSLATMWDVMDHYNKGGEPNPYLDGGMEALALSETEIDQLVAFLFTLTDKRFADLNDKQLQMQREVAAKERPIRDDDIAMRRVLDFEKRLGAGAQKR